MDKNAQMAKGILQIIGGGLLMLIGGGFMFIAFILAIIALSI